MKSFLYYGDIRDPARLKRELLADGIAITSERDVAFTDGTTGRQFTITLPSGQRFHFVPASDAAQQRQLDAGRWLAPYSWVPA